MLNYVTVAYREVSLFDDWRPGSQKIDVSALPLSLALVNIFTNSWSWCIKDLLRMSILEPLFSNLRDE